MPESTPPSRWPLVGFSVPTLNRVGAPLALSVLMFAALTGLREVVAQDHLSANFRLPMQIIVGAVLYISSTWMVARTNVTAALNAARAAR